VSSPLGGLIPTRMNSSGFMSGSSMTYSHASAIMPRVKRSMLTSRSSLIWSPSPPIPANEAPLGSSILMLYTSGSTSLGSILRSLIS
jgi:hypothetical protein